MWSTLEPAGHVAVLLGSRVLLQARHVSSLLAHSPALLEEDARDYSRLLAQGSRLVHSDCGVTTL